MSIYVPRRTIHLITLILYRFNRTHETNHFSRYSDIDDDELLELYKEGYYALTPVSCPEELHNDSPSLQYSPRRSGFLLPPKWDSEFNALSEDLSSTPPSSHPIAAELNALGLQQMCEKQCSSPPSSHPIAPVPSTPKGQKTTRTPKKVLSPSRRSARISSRRKMPETSEARVPLTA